MSTEISLQPWRNYKTDGVILFSDILTPLPVSEADIERKTIPPCFNPLSVRLFVALRPISACVRKTCTMVHLSLKSVVDVVLSLETRRIGKSNSAVGLIQIHVPHTLRCARSRVR